MRTTISERDDVLKLWRSVIMGAALALECPHSAQMAAPLVTLEYLDGVDGFNLRVSLLCPVCRGLHAQPHRLMLLCAHIASRHSPDVFAIQPTELSLTVS